jgi:hypothetical protein
MEVNFTPEQLARLSEIASFRSTSTRFAATLQQIIPELL